ALAQTPVAALVDGNSAPDLPCPYETIVEGDSLAPVISAASILAKVERDRIMREACAAFPGYGFSRHKGYGTPEHHRALVQLGPCAIHRRSFKPVREAERARSAARF
ncbi:MAG TPA: ribonuclease HII, partial [Caulobacterales bacterium]|nr:ribonuclease HII [Caulobacterales bacterium]